MNLGTVAAPSTGQGRRPLVLAGAADAVLSLLDLDETVLSPTERERADRKLRPGDRTDFVAAHLLVRYCAGRLLGRPPQQVRFAQHCAACGATAHGRPYLVDEPACGVSLSHSRGQVAAVAGPGSVGVDVEVLAGPGLAAELAGHVLAPAERAALAGLSPGAATQALLRQWVRKEALVKVGAARLGGFAKVDLSALPAEAFPAAGCVLRQGPEGRTVVDWGDPDTGVLGAAVSMSATADVRLATTSGWAPLPMVPGHLP